MKYSKHILEAVNRGIKLALDDFEDDEVQNQEPILSKKKILNYDAKNDFDFYNSFVDLGLPSRTLWRKFNLGAYKPEQFGNYYQWGDIKPKIEACNILNYKFWENHLCLKYNNIDKLTELLPEDDAAYCFDNRLKMPTKKQILELLQYTSQKWVTDRICNGILFTGKNGNEMFIPAAGYIHENCGLNNIECNIWSSTICMDNNGIENRAAVYLYGSEQHCGEIANYDRYDGFSIRPVLNR